MRKRERDFQPEVIKAIEQLFPECIVVKLDPNYIQGLPDLLVLYKDRWATLECKRSKDAHHQPNQDYYVETMNRMSFSRVIYPENMKEVLHELQLAFES